jgi:nicotinate-nucleotide adenylyltransferase
MKIALFGGAFDPPHVGHKLVAESLVTEKIVDEVWFVSVFKHPWADKYGKENLTSYEDRVAMLELISPNPKVKVAHFKEVSFTYDTLEYFSKKHPEHEFSWVMGSEYLDRFDDFLVDHPRLSEYSFYIYPRAGYEFNQTLKKSNMEFLKMMPEVEVSSTAVRDILASEKSIENKEILKLLNSDVRNYITKSSLYST